MTLLQQVKHWDALLFNETSIDLLRTFSSWGWAVFNLLLGVFVLSLPLTAEEVAQTPAYFAKYVIMYSCLILILFLLSRLFGSDMKLVKFWYTISTLVLFSSIPLMLITYISLFFIEGVLNNAVVSNLIVSVIPYYLFLLMAFASEQSARIENEKRSVMFGIVSVIVVYCVSYFF